MRPKKVKGLWWYFVSMVFIIILSFIVIMSFLAFLYFHVGNGSFAHKGPLQPILLIILLSVVLGTTITIMVGRKILLPISDFSKAAKEISKGKIGRAHV